MTAFTITTLTADDICSVFPLIRESVPGLELSAWLRFARPLADPRRSDHAGVMVARRVERNLPCGLFCYRVDQDLECGRVLIAEYIVAIDLLDPDAVLAALVRELELLGQRLGCRAVRSLVHGSKSPVTGGLAAAGHAPEGSVLLKSLMHSSPAHGAPPSRSSPRSATPKGADSRNGTASSNVTTPRGSQTPTGGSARGVKRGEAVASADRRNFSRKHRVAEPALHLETSRDRG
jgi:hypothetical protein